ncbi:uncharacterized protein LOC119103537 [Pollicipes pollicipes]|uniref:uncharacterized protein LOC119103537 n=1 Tax=Pollicipes pollicipes TaxID=41117 RepID=UPI001884FB9D|nr:uncharacterized protein LOC119103537 [Pollicipes pollicipes]
MSRRIRLLFVAAALLAATAHRAAADDSVQSAAAVKSCYTCMGNQDDNTCLLAPEKEAQPFMKCTRKYCTIIREEYTENPGVAVTITRGCEVKLPHPDGKEVTDQYTRYYWTCTSNLCNTGDGTHAPAGGGGGGGGDVKYVLVEGCGVAALRGGLLTVAGLALLLLLQPW